MVYRVYSNKMWIENCSKVEWPYYTAMEGPLHLTRGFGPYFNKQMSTWLIRTVRKRQKERMGAQFLLYMTKCTSVAVMNKKPTTNIMRSKRSFIIFKDISTCLHSDVVQFQFQCSEFTSNFWSWFSQRLVLTASLNYRGVWWCFSSVSLSVSTPGSLRSGRINAYVSAWICSSIDLVDAEFEAYRQQHEVDFVVDQFVWRLQSVRMKCLG